MESRNEGAPPVTNAEVPSPTASPADAAGPPAAEPGIDAFSGRPDEPAPGASPVVLALLDEAQRHDAGGDSARAAATLERALRIEPRAPVLWTRLAGLRLGQRQYVLAESLALRALSLARHEPDLQHENCRIISRARAALGRADQLAAECAGRRPGGPVE